VNTNYITFTLLFCVLQSMVNAQCADKPIYRSEAYSIYPDRVEQGPFKAWVVSPTEIISNYISPDADKYPQTISFKFSINGHDNEMLSGRDHLVTLQPVNGTCMTQVLFGRQLVQTTVVREGGNLAPNTQWIVRLDMREVISSFRDKGYYTLFNGERLDEADFKGVYVAGLLPPLTWDFNKLHTMPGLQLHDPDGDGIYETRLLMNAKSDEKPIAAQWKPVHTRDAYPHYQSDYPISDAVYNMAVDEMINAVEPDGTFRTGKEWAGVWTRDVSYSILLSMAQMQPEVARNSLMRKVKNNRIIQDTGTGGAYPVSTDRMVWALAAWELYKVTGDKEWLSESYTIIKNTMQDDFVNAYDKETGLMKGESSFLDWREQTYPRWMQPVDIYDSENLGTNAVHYQANRILARMAQLLNDPLSADRYNQQAANLKKGINTHLWMSDKGYYGQYFYGRIFKSLSPRAEALGEALTVLFDIGDEQQRQSVINNTPMTDFGIPCIYPQIPGIPPYHNNAVWPFVQSYWAMAAAKAGNEQSVLESIAAVVRPAALFLTNKENFVSTTGDFAGTQINSSNMLWSLSGSIALVHKVLFGIDFQADQLLFHPFVPRTLAGKRSLTGFRYRNALLNIEMVGYGNQVKSFELDGKTVKTACLPCTLTGTHSVRIVLANNDLGRSKINKISNIISLETPTVCYADGTLSWTPVPGAAHYEILKNGKKFIQTQATSLDVPLSFYSEYQVIAVDENLVSSFASEPVVAVRSRWIKTYEAEEFASSSDRPYKNYQGSGFVEISKTFNQRIALPVNVDHSGTYAVSFRYANGNGPVNTENKCALRTLCADGNLAGTIVMPQRGTDEWSKWGMTNAVQLKLSKGNHELVLSYGPANENMNGEINQAMLDAMVVMRIQ